MRPVALLDAAHAEAEVVSDGPGGKVMQVREHVTPSRPSSDGGSKQHQGKRHAGLCKPYRLYLAMQQRW